VANHKTYVTQTPFSEVKKYKDSLNKFFEENNEYLIKNDIFISDMHKNLSKPFEFIDAELPDIESEKGKDDIYLCSVRMDIALEKFIETEVVKKCEEDSEFISYKKQISEFKEKIYEIRCRYKNQITEKYNPKQSTSEESQVAS